MHKASSGDHNGEWLLRKVTHPNVRHELHVICNCHNGYTRQTEMEIASQYC